MTVVRGDPRLRAGNVLGEPAGVRRRDEAVLLAVPDEHGNGDRRDVEAPRRDEGEVVVDPPLHAAGRAEQLVEVLDERPVEHVRIDAAQQRCPGVAERGRPGRRPRRVLLLDERAHGGLAREGRAKLDHVALAEAGGLVGCRRAERSRGDDAVGQERSARERMRPAAGDPPGRETVDPERVDDGDDLLDDVDPPTVAARRVRVAGPVEADQPHALLLPLRVERARRRRPVVADNGEAGTELVDHSPGFSGVPGRPFGKSSLNRRATGSGTSAETSPPYAAISFTPLDETKLTFGLAITYTVSTSGARCRFSWFIWNSHSKSEITRRPFTIAFACQRCANSTTSSRKTSTSTFSSPASASRRNATRSSTVNIGCLCAGLPTTPTTTRSKIPAARVITSTCPFVTGSYEPGQIAVIIRTP